ncbi:hypothetical protein KFE25_000428 [Diacronema lutheri]|uniref:ABM domain-containing protein n=1 Tax=Diacronema lutheri TaxID=2081491 RepID=A0A8J5XR45_DIALT|nr:hypothetical protein KFE25_000428 [Diacronema lutheri]
MGGVRRLALRGLPSSVSRAGLGGARLLARPLSERHWDTREGSGEDAPSGGSGNGDGGGGSDHERGGERDSDAGSDPSAEFLGLHRAAHRDALRSAIPRRFGGGFRGGGAKAAPAALPGPIARLASARPRGDGKAAIKAEYEASLRGLYASAKGCLGAHLLWDQDKGEAVSLTLWASAEHLSALTETDEYASRMRAFGAHLAGVPEVRTVQVLASVPACPPTGADSGPAPGATGPAQRRA